MPIELTQKTSSTTISNAGVGVRAGMKFKIAGASGTYNFEATSVDVSGAITSWTAPVFPASITGVVPSNPVTVTRYNTGSGAEGQLMVFNSSRVLQASTIGETSGVKIGKQVFLSPDGTKIWSVDGNNRLYMYSRSGGAITKYTFNDYLVTIGVVAMNESNTPRLVNRMTSLGSYGYEEYTWDAVNNTFSKVADSTINTDITVGKTSTSFIKMPRSNENLLFIFDGTSSIYIYERNTTTGAWSQLQQITNVAKETTSTSPNAYFDVSADGSRIAYFDSSTTTMKIKSRSGSTWSDMAYTETNVWTDYGKGRTVCMSGNGNRVWVGNLNDIADHSIWCYSWNGSAWVATTHLYTTASNSYETGEFMATDTTGNTIYACGWYSANSASTVFYGSYSSPTFTAMSQMTTATTNSVDGFTSIYMRLDGLEFIIGDQDYVTPDPTTMPTWNIVWQVGRITPKYSGRYYSSMTLGFSGNSPTVNCPEQTLTVSAFNPTTGTGSGSINGKYVVQDQGGSGYTDSSQITTTVVSSTTFLT